MSELILNAINTEAYSEINRKLESFPEFIRQVFKFNKFSLLNVVLTDAFTVRNANHQTRGKDAPTDVLSWGYLEEEEYAEWDDELIPLLGEIMICDEVCARQAEENGWDFDTEFIRLAVHGVAHVFGYDHQNHNAEAEMLKKEIELLTLLGLPDLYPENTPAHSE